MVYAAESLRVEIAQLDGLRNISFEEAYKDTASLRGERFPELRPVQAMAFSEAAAAAQLAVQRRQPYVTAHQLLEVRIEPGVMKYTATFFYNIAYSGVKSLRIDLPAAIAGDVRNQTETLRESALAEQDGYVGWVLVPVGKTELLGETQVKLSWETPIADLGLGKSVPLHVPRLIPRNVNRQDGQIVLVKSETIDVQPQGVPQGLDPIDPEHDLISGVRVLDAAAALQFQDNDWDLTLVATRYELQPLTQTSIEQAVLRQVITRSDRVSVQALYRMRSNQQRLKLQLPAEAQLDTDPLRINGRRITLERGDDDRSYFVPLIGMAPNEPFLLELRYTTSGNGSRLTYPGFPDEPAVQKVNLLAYVPQERSLLGHAGPWTDELIWVRGNLATQQPVPRVNADELLRQLTQGINLAGNPAEEFPVDGRPLLFSTLRPPDPAAKTPDTGCGGAAAEYVLHAVAARVGLRGGHAAGRVAAATSDRRTVCGGLCAAGDPGPAGCLSADVHSCDRQPDPAVGRVAGAAAVAGRVPAARLAASVVGDVAAAQSRNSRTGTRSNHGRVDDGGFCRHARRDCGPRGRSPP